MAHPMTPDPNRYPRSGHVFVALVVSIALWAVMVVAVCAGLSALLILALKPLFVRYLLARPNARSSHQIATSSGCRLR